MRPIWVAIELNTAKNGWSFFRAGLLYVAAGPQLSHMALLSHSVL